LRAAAASSVAVRDNDPTDVIGALENKFPPVEFGAIERLKGSSGQIMDANNGQLGSWVKLELMSWNYLYTISPGSDKADARELVRYSLDGKTIDNTGQSVDEYVKHLREVEKYPDASVKKYVSLIGILLGSEKPSKHLQDVVEVSLSPTAAKKFSSGHRLQVTVARRQGRLSFADAQIVMIRAEVTTNKKNQTYTFLEVKDK
jgi:hypothetical protein